MYYIWQSGFEGTWCNDDAAVVRYLCDVFGWDFSEVFEDICKILSELEIDTRGKMLDENLSIHVRRLK